jgi:mRNA-degrading endonuclease toxin of MazEF toxin-antitoxin module
MVFPLHPGFTSVKSGRFDRERLVKRLGAVDGATMRQVDETLKVSLGLAGF